MRWKDRSGFHGEYSCEVDGERIVQAFRKAALDGLRAFMEGLEAGLSEESAAGTSRQAQSREAQGREGEAES